jgi:hypothetical protein
MVPPLLASKLLYFAALLNSLSIKNLREWAFKTNRPAAAQIGLTINSLA